MYDVAIIGTGVVGTTIARELSRYKLKTVMLDKENDIAAGTTKANSAIVHAGYDADYRTKMAGYNVRGNALYPKICEELSVPFKRTGSLVCAHSEEEILTLQALFVNGKRLNIPGLEILDRDEVRAREPHLSRSVTAALYAPTAGITEPWELAIACAENAVHNGTELKLNYEVKSIKQTGSAFYIISSKDEIVCSRLVINCAGVYADRIAGMVLEEPGFKITPRRGQYYLLDKSEGDLVRSVIFPVPTKEHGKGVLVAPTVDGNIIVGPTAEDLDDDQRESTETTAQGLKALRGASRSNLEKIPYDSAITVFSGLRAEADRGDFIIEFSDAAGFINVAGIKSPGLSAAPAIAEDVAEMVLNYMGSRERNPDFSPYRRPRPKMELMSPGEKADLIRLDPRFGNIICRCEMISEGEIVDAIHRKAGATTLNGIKRRVRPGAGRCQGGFCGPRVMAILTRELGMDPTDVCQEAAGAAVLVGSTREIDGGCL